MTCLSIGADENLPIVQHIISTVKEKGFTVISHLPNVGTTGVWSQIAQQVAEDLRESRADEGILLCWTGTGMSIAANKVPGIRAALCDDAATARGARLWNNANILCLSMRRLSNPVANEILESWFTTSYQPNATDDHCLQQITHIETKYNKPHDNR